MESDYLMTERIYNLNCKLLANADSRRKSDRRLLEQLVSEALKGMVPEAIVLKVKMEQVTKKK